MKRLLVYILLLITLFVLQGTLFSGISFAGTVPNLLLVLTVSLGLMRGEKTGMAIGFFSGLLMDIFTGSTIGFLALVYMYLGYGSGSFNKIFYPEDIKLPMFMITICDLLYGFIYYVIMFLMRGRLNIGNYFLHVILPECVYTILVTVVLYPIILLLDNLLKKDELRRNKKFVSR